MRRIAVLVMLAVTVTGAALASGPAVVTPEFSGPADIPPVPTASASVWYCPWINAGAESDAAFLLASEAAGEATMTLPGLVANEPADTDIVAITGPGSRIVDVGTIVRRGDAPGFVEFDAGPAAASAVVWEQGVLSADRCVSSVPKIWHLAGGTTREGRSLVVRLFNPFPDDVRVSVTGTSEFGAEPLPEFSLVDIPGRSWRNLELSPVVPLLDDLALVVTATTGVIIPSMVLSGDVDEATWPGTALSTSWTFPIAGLGSMSSVLAITNPGAEDVTVAVDLLLSSGRVPDAVMVDVAAGSPARIDLGALVDGDYGIGVRASGAIAAVVIAEDQQLETGASDGNSVGTGRTLDRIAATVGAERSARRWLLAGAGGVPDDATSSVWIYNPAPEPVTVSLEPLGVRDLPVEKIVVAPETRIRFDAPVDIAIGSYLIDAPTPVVAAWSAHAVDAVAFVAGVAVGE
ncbi:MAG: DUF5719 family protein [Acidimicrobiia bacterium]